MSIHSMLRPALAALGLAAALSLVVASHAQDEFTAPLTELAKGEIAAFANDPALVAAIVAQNAVTGAYDQARSMRWIPNGAPRWAPPASR